MFAPTSHHVAAISGVGIRLQLGQHARLAPPTCFVDVAPAASQREKGSEGNPISRASIENSHFVPFGNMEVVLDSDDGGDRTSLGKVGSVYVAETEVADQAFLAHSGQHLEAFGQGFTVWGFHHADTEIDQIEAFQTVLRDNYRGPSPIYRNFVDSGSGGVE